jgi:hypothetical protein
MWQSPLHMRGRNQPTGFSDVTLQTSADHLRCPDRRRGFWAIIGNEALAAPAASDV